MGFCLLRLAAAASLVSVSAAANSTAHKVSIKVDGKAVPFYRCFINSSSLRNRNSDPIPNEGGGEFEPLQTSFLEHHEAD